MCGRYTLIVDLSQLMDRFAFTYDGEDYAPSYNVAPTQAVLAVTNEGELRGERLRWGLIPSWAKDASIGNRMINARAETVTERPSFRSAIRHRRCLVPADGFYEWQRVGSAKRPMRVVMKSGEPFAFAGLWETWKSPESEVVRSCTIITTAANELMEPIHARMPVILSRQAEALWLDGRVQDSATLLDVLTPYPSGEMEAYEVSRAVNSPSNNRPDCIARVA